MGTSEKPAVVRPSERELEVLEVLWERGPSTVREVMGALGGEPEAGYTSWQKIMSIMLDKSLVSRVAEGRVHRYAARVARSDVRRRLAAELLDRVFGGSVAALVQSSLATRATSEEELREVEALIEAAMADKPASGSEEMG